MINCYVCSLGHTLSSHGSTGSVQWAVTMCSDIKMRVAELGRARLLNFAFVLGKNPTALPAGVVSCVEPPSVPTSNHGSLFPVSADPHVKTASVKDK